MKKLSGLLIMLILVPAHAQWEEYPRSPDGDMAHYYDATQLVRAQNTFKLPIKVEQDPPVVSLRSDLRVAFSRCSHQEAYKRESNDEAGVCQLSDSDLDDD